MKKKQELFDRVLQIVAEETEITPDVILSTNKTVEVVDARHILVVSLLDCGLYVGTIALLSGMTSQAVRKIRNEFETRLKTSNNIFKINYKNIRNSLESNNLL